MAGPRRFALARRRAEFIGERDSFYMASVGATGWPYVQHRGGGKGFLKVIDENTLAFADFRGNKQYISTGNLMTDNRVAFILLDYPRQAAPENSGPGRDIRRRAGEGLDPEGARPGVQDVYGENIRHTSRGLRLELSTAHRSPLHGGGDSGSGRSRREADARTGAGEREAPGRALAGQQEKRQWLNQITPKEKISMRYNHYQRRHRNLLQGLGQGTAHRFQPWLAA